MTDATTIHAPYALATATLSVKYIPTGSYRFDLNCLMSHCRYYQLADVGPVVD